MALVALLSFCAVALGSSAGPSATGDFRCRGAIATIVGTAGDDRIIGTRHDDVIVARAGDDVVRAGKGDDKVCDNDGADHVVLGAGDDEAGGGDGADQIGGGGGADWLAGRRGNDMVEGGPGADRLVGERGDDRLRGGRGNDSLGGGPGRDDCRGGPGADVIRTCETGDGRPDRPPVAADDTDSTSETAPKDVPVLSNDSDPDGDPLSVASLDTSATTGQVTITGGGTGVRYDPAGRFSSLAPGEIATDSFRYTLGGGTGPATVIITIAGVDTPPTAGADARTVTEDDSALMIDVLANDTDPDGGEAKSIQSVTQPPHGTAVITGGGSALTYEPDPDYCNSPSLGSPDTFAYTLTPGGSSGSVGVTVTCVNDAPALSTTASTLAWVEGGGALPVDSGLTLTDIDSANLQGATVAITGNHNAAQDALVFTNQLGITGTYNSGTGVLTLSGTSSVANYQTALRSVRYENSSDTPSTLTRTVSFQGTDSSAAPSNTDTRDVSVAATNDAPTVTTTAGTTAYTEGGADATVDSGLTVTDPDDTNLEGATVRLSAGFQSGDSLLFTDQLGITGSYDSGTGVLTLSGTASKADYQTALRSVEFETSNDNPAASKTVEFKANDGDADSNAATKGIAITGVNDAPTLTTSASALSYGEDSGPVAVDAALTATDPDSANFSGATVQITSNFVSAEDDLDFSNQLGITGSYNDSTGTLTLSGTASVADYQAALRAVTYENSSHNPSTATRTVSFQATDASAAPSNIATRDISVGAANDAPVVTTSGGSTAFTEGGADATVDSGLTVTDPDDTNLEGATVRLSAGFQSGDSLLFADQNGITGSYASGTGVLTLTGTSSVANYQTALRSIQFQTTNDNPTSPKTVEFKANDGDSDGNAATKNLSITGVNDAPAMDTSGSALAYSEGDGAVSVDNGLSVTDPDSANLAGATVQLTGNFTQSEDELAFTNQNGITGSYDDSTGTLTLSGTSSVANYQTALRWVTYENSSDTPSTLTRTVSFQATDSSSAASNTDTRDITVAATNDAPTVTTTAGDTAYTEGDPGTIVDGGVTVSDVDDANLEGATVRLSAGFQTGDELGFTNQLGISGSYDSGTGVLTLTGTASKADYQTALRAITFETTNGNPSASKTVEFKVNDGDDDSNGATRGIAIASVNSAPTIGAGGTLSYTENDAATPVHSTLTVSDPESNSITGASASVTSGFLAEDALAWVDNNGADNVTLDVANSDAQTIVLTGVDTDDNYQAALRAVTYFNSTEAPSTAARTVTFSATDDLSATGTGTRTIAVTSVDDPPVAVGDGATMLEDASATSVPVLTNDTDVDAGPKTIASATDPANGTVVLTGGSPGAHTGLTYQPDPNYCNDPPGNATDTFDYTLNGGSSATVSITVTCVNDAPVADDETFNGDDSAHGNTTMIVNDPDDGAPSPSHPKTTVSGDILAGDTDVDGPGPLTVTPGTFATNDGGSVTIESDGDFTFHPAAATSCTDTSDFFDYTVEDSGSPEQTDTGRVTVAIAGCVWYVNNNAAGNSGTSSQPFDTLAQAEAASGSNHTVFVFDGDNTTSGHAAGFTMNSGERLIGEHEGLVVDPDQGGALNADTLHPANPGAHPTLTDDNADVVELDDGNEVRGFNIDPQGTGGGIAGGSGDTGGGTIDDVNVIDTGTAGTDPGLELNATTGTFNISDFTYDNTGVPSAAAGVAIINAGTVSFGTGDAGDPTKINKTGGPALNVLSTGMGTSTFDEITVGDSATGGIDLTNITAGSSTTFGDGSGTDLNLTTTSGSTPAFRITSGSGVTVPAGGTADVHATGGPAVDVTSTTGATLNFDDVDSTSSAGDGINLSGLGAGTFSADGNSTIGGAAGISFDLDGGSGTVTFPGTFNDGAGQTAEITSRSGGAVTFSGPVNDTNDQGGGISLSTNTGGSTTFSNATKTINTTTSGSPTQNNAITMLASDGHTLNLTGGGLDIDSTGRGLQADTSGTLSVTGSGNTINSISGVALDVSNTDIDASDLTFQRIDAGNTTAAADPANGVVLNTTGNAGELTITSTGSGTCTDADTGGCTGGTIQNTTGADSSSATPPGTGIVLNSTSAASLTRMLIRDHTNYGVRGTSVAGLTLDRSVITASGSGFNGTIQTGGNEEGGARFVNLSGTATISNSFLSRGWTDNFRVVNDTGSLNITFSDNNVGTNNLVDGNAGVLVETASASGAALTSTFTNHVSTLSRGDHIHWSHNGSGVGSLTVTGGDFSSSSTPGSGGGGVFFTSDADAGNTTMNIQNNDFKQARGPAVLVAKTSGAGAAVQTGTFANNSIGISGQNTSGSSEGNGLQMENLQNGQFNWTVTGNDIHGYDENAIHVAAGGSVNGAGGVLNTTITGNTIDTPGPQSVQAKNGIHYNIGVGVGDTFSVCADVKNNNIFAAGLDQTGGGTGDIDARFRQRANTTIRLPGYGGATNDNTAVQTFVANNNLIGGTPAILASNTVGSGGGGFIGTGTTCP